MRDFTLGQYEALCAALVKAGYHSLTMSAYMAGDAIPEKVVLLRHDVDRDPMHALKLAEIEQRHGLLATYFFRTIPSLFNPEALKATHALGHEIGYHYETLAQTRGDIPAAIQHFGAELDRMRQFVPVPVASMHGSPLSRFDNRAIWQHTTPAEFDLVGEAYRDIDYRRMVYLNDTGRTWHPTRYNLRDKTGILPTYQPHTTADLIALVESDQVARLCISAHPERWQVGGAWHRQRGRDVALNLIKLALQRLRTR